jgi:hypothetical protein
MLDPWSQWPALIRGYRPGKSSSGQAGQKFFLDGCGLVVKKPKRNMAAEQTPWQWASNHPWRSAAYGLICLTVALGSWAAPLRQARGLWVPIYIEPKPDPVASIRIDRVYRDHRRMGFFRVRALPVMVAQGVQLEVREPAGATNLLQELSRALEALAGSRGVEARQVSIRIGSTQTPSFQARRLVPPAHQGSQVFVLEQVQLKADQQQIELPRAKAQLARPGVLRLVRPDGAMLDYDLSCGSITFNPSEPSGENL